MAGKIDKEFLDDTRKEHRENHFKNNGSEKTTNNSTNSNEGNNSAGSNEQADNANDPKNDFDKANSTNENSQSENSQSHAAHSEPVKDDFEEKFNDYFKGAESIIAGDAIVNMVDNLKTNLLWIYAKKCKVEIPKEALEMDAKSKKFTAFLVDHAVKNKLFGWMKKYPLIAAAGVVGLSAGGTYLAIEAMKKRDDENKDLKDLVEKLKREKAEMERKNANDAEIVT